MLRDQSAVTLSVLAVNACLWLAAGCSEPIVAGGATSGGGSTGTTGQIDNDSGPSDAGTDDTSGGPSGESDDTGPDEDECQAPVRSCVGCEDWLVSYEGPTATNDRFRAVTLLPDGDIVVAGMQGAARDPRAPDGDTLVVRYSPDGEQVWQRTLPVANERDTAISVASDNIGEIIVGTTTAARVGTLWKLTTDGDVLWELEGPGPDASPASSIVTSESDFFVSGGGFSLAAFLQKRASDGAVLWAATDVVLGEPVDGYGRMDVAANGDVVVTASRVQAQESVVARFSGTGDLLWTHLFGPDDGFAEDVVVLPDDRVVFVGADRSVRGKAVPALGLLDASGVLEWSTTYATEDCCTGLLSHVVATPDSRVFAVGTAARAGNHQTIVAFEVDLDCMGRIVWQANPVSTVNASAFAGGAVAADDALLVAGDRTPQNGDAAAWLTSLRPD
jgi:hypothetical protein